MPDASTSASIVSLSSVAVTAILTLMTTLSTKKDRRERRADRDEKEATAEKLRAEKEEITQRASSIALTSVQSELARVQEQLKDAYNDADRLRVELVKKNNQIDEQDRTIRRLTRRAETLEEWINNNMERFEELGINGLPLDDLGDRHHHEKPHKEEDPL